MLVDKNDINKADDTRHFPDNKVESAKPGISKEVEARDDNFDPSQAKLVSTSHKFSLKALLGLGSKEEKEETKQPENKTAIPACIRRES